jgi:hypothetical protein
VVCFIIHISKLSVSDLSNCRNRWRLLRQRGPGKEEERTTFDISVICRWSWNMSSHSSTAAKRLDIVTFKFFFSLVTCKDIKQLYVKRHCRGYNDDI